MDEDLNKNTYKKEFDMLKNFLVSEYGNNIMDYDIYKNSSLNDIITNDQIDALENIKK